MGEIFLKRLNRSIATVWLLGTAVAACVIVGICFLTNPPREYQVRITVPAGSEEPFAYSDEEICSKSRTITVYAGEGLGDTEILLFPVGNSGDGEMRSPAERGQDGTEPLPLPEMDQEETANPIGPVYLTQGMPVRLDVERETWYRVGVNVQNPAAEERDVFVTVKNVDIRIADSAGMDFSGTEGDGTAGADGADIGGTGADAADGSGAGSGAADGNGTGTATVDNGGAESGVSGTQGDGQPEQSGTEAGENAGLPEDWYAPHRYDMGDLDGNGEQEYVMICFWRMI